MLVDVILLFSISCLNLVWSLKYQKATTSSGDGSGILKSTLRWSASVANLSLNVLMCVTSSRKSCSDDTCERPSLATSYIDSGPCVRISGVIRSSSADVISPYSSINVIGLFRTIEKRFRPSTVPAGSAQSHLPTQGW